MLLVSRLVWEIFCATLVEIMEGVEVEAEAKISMILDGKEYHLKE